MGRLGVRELSTYFDGPRNKSAFRRTQQRGFAGPLTLPPAGLDPLQYQILCRLYCRPPAARTQPTVPAPCPRATPRDTRGGALIGLESSNKCELNGRQRQVGNAGPTGRTDRIAPHWRAMLSQVPDCHLAEGRAKARGPGPIGLRSPAPDTPPQRDLGRGPGRPGDPQLVYKDRSVTSADTSKRRRGDGALVRRCRPRFRPCVQVADLPGGVPLVSGAQGVDGGPPPDRPSRGAVRH